MLWRLSSTPSRSGLRVVEGQAPIPEKPIGLAHAWTLADLFFLLGVENVFRGKGLGTGEIRNATEKAVDAWLFPVGDIDPLACEYDAEKRSEPVPALL